RRDRQIRRQPLLEELRDDRRRRLGRLPREAHVVERRFHLRGVAGAQLLQRRRIERDRRLCRRAFRRRLRRRCRFLWSLLCRCVGCERHDDRQDEERDGDRQRANDATTHDRSALPAKLPVASITTAPKWPRSRARESSSTTLGVLSAPSMSPVAPRSRPPKRPWYLVAALVAGWLLGANAMSDGCQTIQYYRGEALNMQAPPELTDVAARQRVVELAQKYVAVMDAARGRLLPIGVALLVLGAAMVMLSARAMSGRPGARGALVQVT